MVQRLLHGIEHDPRRLEQVRRGLTRARAKGLGLGLDREEAVEAETRDDAARIVVEWAPFRLAENADEASLLRASEALQRDFLQHQKGFLRRELLRGKDGQWADLVYWADAESADAIMPAVAESPVCHTYFALMTGADPADPAGGVSHFRRVRSYE